MERNDLDAFEQRLRDTLQNYEVPYNSSDWAQMERALSSGVRGWGHGRAWMAGLLLAGGLLIGSTAYFLGRDTVKAEEAGGPAASGTVAEPAATPSAMLVEAAPAKTEQPANVPEVGTTAPRVAGDAAKTAPAGNPATPAPAVHPAPVRQTGTTPPTGPVGNEKAASVFKASVKEACPGSPVEFTVENMPEDGIYLWNFGDGSFSNKANPEHVFTKPGRYQVMLSMSATGVGSIRNKPTSDVIVIHEVPHAAFNIMKMDYPGLVPSVHFENRSLGAASYHWDLGDGTVSTEASPDHVYRKKGTYQVVQTVTNEIGCTDRKVQELRIERDFDLGAAKSFSPNDDGKEDSFMPTALRDLRSKFQLAVYDQGGTMVYSTSDASRPWYGKLRNQGPVLPAGDYVWVADVETGRRSETFTGTVKLVR